jgi:uncharacterized membrane protein
MLNVYLWHPIFVHFSVALLSVAVVLYALAATFRNSAWQPQWTMVALWNLWIGLAFTVFTVGFGWLAFNTVNHDDISHEAMVIHRNWALATASGFGVLGLWSFWRRREREPSRVFAGLLVICLGLLAMTGLRGGELVFRYGLAVSSLPKADEETPQPPITAVPQSPPREAQSLPGKSKQDGPEAPNPADQAEQAQPPQAAPSNDKKTAPPAPNSKSPHHHRHHHHE